MNEFPCTKHEAEIIHLKDDVSELKEKNKTYDVEIRDFTKVVFNLEKNIDKLTMLFEQQVKEGAERDKIRKEQSEALNSLSISSQKQTETLEKLNERMERIESKTNELDDKFDKKTTELDMKIVETNKKWYFDWSGLVPKIILFLLGSGVAYVFLNTDKIFGK